MATELATVEKRTALAHPLEFSNEQIKILSETIAKGTTESELAFFLNVCRMKRLDPFTGQVHCVKRWDRDLGRDKMTIQVGIDGFRVIAARSGELAGITEPEFDSEDEKHPNWARVTVYRYGRGDEKIAYSAKARYEEYKQTKQNGDPNHMWTNKPFIMLGKCAEALALRKAFPDELSGMYSDEEMDQADGGVTPASVDKKPVNMPKSTDEKKPQAVKSDPPKAQTTSTPNDTPEKISGEIEKSSPGKGPQEGSLWIVVDKRIICIPKELIDAEMVPGAKVLIVASKIKGGTVEKYMALEVEMVVPPQDNTIEGEIIESKTDPVLNEARAQGLSGIFDDAPKAPAADAEATKPGTIGIKRAKRLYTLISQNHKNTGFTEEELKKIMSALPNPLEHVRDIDLGMYAEFEKWATGETDYKDFWKE